MEKEKLLVDICIPFPHEKKEFQFFQIVKEYQTIENSKSDKTKTYGNYTQSKKKNNFFMFFLFACNDLLSKNSYERKKENKEKFSFPVE